MTDLSRIRRHLLAGNPVCALDWDGSTDVIDGGKPIKRVAARIEELRQEGLNVVTTGKRNRMSVYEYVVDPAIRELRESSEPNPWKRPEPEPVVLAFDITSPEARVALAAAFDYSDRLAAERKAA